MSVKIGLVGTGTVGGGCIDIIQKHREDFKRHFGVDIELARVCSLDKGEAEAHGVGHLFTSDFHDIINDSDIDLVIELIGGTGVAHAIVTEALKAGKHVVTANKALMATAGEEIFRIADEAGVEIAFEASVGGGIPIIDPLKHSLISNEISSVLGIVNGTTNYMLTRMDEDGMAYDQVLAEAQAKGFAEADPTADVEGIDAANKLSILMALAFDQYIPPMDIPRTGITGVTGEQLRAARERGCCIKLIAHAARKEDGSLSCDIRPTEIPFSHPLAGVNNEFNAVYVTGDAVGEVMFYGKGAGALPTGSAVVGDLIAIMKQLSTGCR